MTKRRFRPTWWATLLTVVGVAAGIRLGIWQSDRAQGKIAIVETIRRNAAAPAVHLGPDALNASSLENRTVETRGEFDPRGMVLLDNRVNKKRVGYEVIMPLRIAGSDMYVLINRGWVAGTGDRSHIPHVPTPAGEVGVTGLAVVPGRNMYELSADSVEGQVWQNLTIERYIDHMHYKVHPILVRQTNEASDGLEREWVVSDREINVHRSYSFQWYAIAALIFIVYFILSFKRDTSND